MMLRNPDSISRTGETLAIRMEANYTVIKDKQDDFEAANLICTQKNCPHVFALGGSTLDAQHLSATTSLLEKEAGGESGAQTFWAHRRAECDSPEDAQDGCTVVSGDTEKGFRQATTEQGGLKDPDGELQTIEQGEIAVKIDDTSNDIFSACTRKGNIKNSEAASGVHGIEMSDLDEITGRDADPQLNWTGSEWELEDERSPCLPTGV